MLYLLGSGYNRCFVFIAIWLQFYGFPGRILTTPYRCHYRYFGWPDSALPVPEKAIHNKAEKLR